MTKPTKIQLTLELPPHAISSIQDELLHGQSIGWFPDGDTSCIDLDISYTQPCQDDDCFLRFGFEGFVEEKEGE